MSINFANITISNATTAAQLTRKRLQQLVVNLPVYRRNRYRRNMAAKDSTELNNNSETVDLSTQLDNVSTDSENEGLVDAIEEASATSGDMTEPFYETASSPDGDSSNYGQSPPSLTDEERDRLKAELAKTEDEINTLKQVLAARVKHASELKRKLGLSTWREIQDDVSHGFKAMKDTPAYQRTEEFVHQAGQKTTQAVSTVGKKLGELRNTPYFKSVEDKVGTAYTTVKAKISASSSMDQFYGGQRSEGPTTPDDGTLPGSNVAENGDRSENNSAAFPK